MKKTFILGTLDRFGYYLESIGYTEEEVRKAIMEEYSKAYISRNGVDPREDESDRYGEEGRTAYEVAEEDIEISEYTLGKVEWL